MKTRIQILILFSLLVLHIKCLDEPTYFIQEPEIAADGEKNKDGEAGTIYYLGEDENVIINDLGECQPLEPTQKNVTNITLPLGESSLIGAHRCIQYLIPLNYRITNILIKSQVINHMIISDKPIGDCDEQKFKTCPDGSTFCINSKNTVEQVTSHQIGICLDTVYVSLFINCTSSGLYGDIYASYSPSNSTCNAIDDSDMKVKCSKFPAEVCGSYDKELCYEECAWINCTIINDKNKNISVYGQCVPSSNYRQQDWDDICRANYQYNMVDETDLATGSKKAVSYPVWCGDVPPVDVAKQVADKLGVSEDSVWGTLFLFLFFIFLLSICYYRMKFKRDGVPPFNPPNFCPNFIYPRTYQVRNYSQEENSAQSEMAGYQPPQNL